MVAGTDHLHVSQHKCANALTPGLFVQIGLYRLKHVVLKHLMRLKPRAQQSLRAGSKFTGSWSHEAPLHRCTWTASECTLPQGVIDWPNSVYGGLASLVLVHVSCCAVASGRRKYVWTWKNDQIYPWLSRNSIASKTAKHTLTIH